MRATIIEGDLQPEQREHQFHMSEEPGDREVQELRDKVEQAIVCINAALYVLLKKIESPPQKIL